MPAEAVEIVGSFTANKDTAYKVEHYTKNLGEDKYTLRETENLTGETDTKATATPKTYEGFTFDEENENNVLEGIIAGDGSLVLKVYYTRNTHTVTYSYTGTTPEGASTLPAVATYEYGANVTIAANATAPGYKFSGWDRTEAFQMPDEDVTITGSFTINKYTVTATVEGEGGSVTPPTQQVEYKANSTPITITANEGYELLKVTDNGTDVTAKVTNGQYVSENVTEDRAVVVTFKKVGNLVLHTASDYPKADGTDAEPGDTVTLTFSITEENGEITYPRTLTIKLGIKDRDGNIKDNKITVDASSLPAGATYDEETDTLTWTVNSVNDTASLKVTIANTVNAGSKLMALEATGARVANEVITPIEQTVTVKKPSNKNIVMVLDVSGSMKLCSNKEHGSEYALITPYYGEYYAENTYGCIECGREHVTSTTTGSGWNTQTTYKCSVHGTSNIKTVNISGEGTVRYCDTCARAYTSRIEALKTATHTFANSVIDNRGDSNITITLIPFATNNATKPTLTNPTISQVDAQVNTLTATGKTYINKALVEATSVFNNSSRMLPNATNILVFLSDGAPSSGQSASTTTLANLNKVSKLEKFAVGIGEYDKNELTKIVGSTNASTRIFEAGNSAQLSAAFQEIADKINSMQTDDGYLGDTLDDKTNIYPVVLSYTDDKGVKQEIIANNYSDLQANNVTIEDQTDGKYRITWDIAHYPEGSTNFVIKLGINTATRMLKSSKMMMKSNSLNVNNSLSEDDTATNCNIANLYDGEVILGYEIIEESSTSNIEQTELSRQNILSAIKGKVESEEVNSENVETIIAKVDKVDETKTDSKANQDKTNTTESTNTTKSTDVKDTVNEIVDNNKEKTVKDNGTNATENTPKTVEDNKTANENTEKVETTVVEENKEVETDKTETTKIEQEEKQTPEVKQEEDKTQSDATSNKTEETTVKTEKTETKKEETVAEESKVETNNKVEETIETAE